LITLPLIWTTKSSKSELSSSSESPAAFSMELSENVYRYIFQVLPSSYEAEPPPPLNLKPPITTTTTITKIFQGSSRVDMAIYKVKLEDKFFF
jgi:hypothetical protein